MGSAEHMTATAEAARPLEMRGVTAGYGRSTVLRDIDLGVERGKIGALLGPNGAGKTTLLRVCAGLLPAWEGAVWLNGSNHTQTSVHDRVRAGLCLIPEGRGIFRSLSVHENLILQRPPWERDKDMERALEVFPILRDRLRQTAGTMSGGQQQMLALARCYLTSPEIVLLDEVSMGLAPRIVDEIFETLSGLAAEGISLLLVEQYVNRALELADTVHILNRGRVSYAGPAASLDQDTVMEGYLGADLIADGDQGPGWETLDNTPT
jgi:branched-chain amino acid transport system ATP-binding protein